MQLRIAIVEDELIVVKDLSRRLKKMGYEVSATFSDGESLIAYLKGVDVDLLLLDINLDGQLDGIETLQRIKETQHIPAIFITAQSDHSTFAQAKHLRPSAYLIKPYNDLDLQTSIELAIENNQALALKSQSKFFVNEKIFVRSRDRFKKIDLQDIAYMVADGNYTDIYTLHEKYTITAKLGQLEQELHEGFFFRCHRSYMVNLKAIDGFDDANLYIGEKRIPISKTLKKELLERLRVV